MSADSHVLVAFEKLPDRWGMGLQEKARLRDGDVREAMARAARRLNDQAQKYQVLGYSWDLEEITFDVDTVRYADTDPDEKYTTPSIIATLKVSRAR